MLKVGYIFVDTHNIILTTREEYLSRKPTLLQHHCLQILCLHTKKTAEYQRRI
jgi:hypothetical protein